MRIFHQRKINELLKGLDVINDNVKDALSYGKKEAALEILTKTPGVISEIEDIIGGKARECPNMVQGLETLKTAFAGARADLEGGKSLGNSFYKFLKKTLLRAQGAAGTEIKITALEVVFIASRGSTFDSMETVYRAAAADPACNVTFVAVGIFQSNHVPEQADLDFYKSKGIDVTDFKSYNFTAKRPDIVFFDYPYAEFGINFVKEETLTEYLRKHCHLLVHLPYFVTASDKKIVATRDFVLSNGVLHSDYVFLQSETIRQRAIKDMSVHRNILQAAGNVGKAEEKFVALGSPKIDNIIGSSENDYIDTLPDDWRKKIYKENGERRKIILFNTHFNMIEKFGVKYAKRFLSVFNILKSKDIILWWRPHPNCEIHLSATNPPMVAVLKSLEILCRTDPSTIYDNTPELNRALAMADAIYGCGSSIFIVFLATGRPTMIQCNVDFDIEELLAWWGPDNNNAPLKPITKDPTSINHLIYRENEENNVLNLAAHLKSSAHNIISEEAKAVMEDFLGPTDGKCGERIYDFCKGKVMST